MILLAAAVALALAAPPAPTATPAGPDTPPGITRPDARVRAPLPFGPGEEIELDIDYGHVHSGKARLTVGRPEGSVWPIIWTARTDGVAAVFDVRAHYVAYWDAGSGLARGSDLNAIEVHDRHTDRLRFDRQGGKLVVAVLRKGELRERTRPVPPDAQEMAGALLHLRAQPLAPGSRFEYPVVSGDDVFVLRGQVEDRETITTPAGRFETVRVAIQLGFTGRAATRGPSYVWVSTDERHVPVRMKGEFAMGSLTATLSAYRPGGPFVAKP